MRTRNEDGYRNTVSKDGTFSPHLDKATTERLSEWCSIMNISKTKFVCECVNKILDEAWKEFYQNATKEELIRYNKMLRLRLSVQDQMELE